jgi:hypothetical protein
VPTTALNHFTQDIARARAIVNHADPLPIGTADEVLLRGDLLRSGWMFAVGALDAYFCDAYTDVVAATIISKKRHDTQNAPAPGFELPEFFLKIEFPVRAILEPYQNNFNWIWRMAAREMMADENVLDLEKIRGLFNKFFRPDQKFFFAILPTWLLLPAATRRMFGITGVRYDALPEADKGAVVQAAWERMQDRFETIFQRRHDCIHNCDRPRVAPQSLAKADTVRHVIDDVEFLVQRCDAHITAEFRQFLIDRGCPNAIIALAGY